MTDIHGHLQFRHGPWGEQGALGGEQVGSSFGWTPIIFLHKFRLGGEEIKKGVQGRKGKK